MAELESALAALAESRGSIRFIRHGAAGDGAADERAREVLVFHRGRTLGHVLGAGPHGATPAEAVVHLVRKLDEEAARLAPPRP